MNTSALEPTPCMQPLVPSAAKRQVHVLQLIGGFQQRGSEQQAVELTRSLHLSWRYRVRAASFLDYAAGWRGAVTATHDGLPFYENNRILGNRLSGISVSQRSEEWYSDSAHQLLSEFLA